MSQEDVSYFLSDPYKDEGRSEYVLKRFDGESLQEYGERCRFFQTPLSAFYVRKIMRNSGPLQDEVSIPQNLVSNPNILV